MTNGLCNKKRKYVIRIQSVGQKNLMGRDRLETCTQEIISVLFKLRSGFVWLRIWKMAAVENTVINFMAS